MATKENINKVDNTIPKFPESLLSGSVDDRVNYFDNFQVAHPHFKKAKIKLLDAINNPGNNSIITVIGPSGVGKSTLYKNIMYNIIQNFVPINKGQIPIVGVEAIAPDSSNFDIRDFYIRSLQELKEPLIEYKVFYENENDIDYRKDDKNRDLRRSLENALRRRSPKAFLIDEAQHFTKVSSGAKYESQMDLLKSLASLSKVLHVMIGTYELVPFLNQSGQLSRRGLDIHFPRYKVENKKDMEVFENVVYMFQRKIPLEIEPDLISNVDLLYKRTIGCVGILKDWLFRAVKKTLESNEKMLTIDCLNQHAHSIDQCMTMLLEARQYEDYDVESKAKMSDYERLLYEGIKPEIKEEREKGKRGKSKPGIRKANRDKVGVD